jgi:hypothetical protein
MSESIEDFLTPKPEARPRIDAYAIADAALQGQLKVGQSTRNVEQRVAARATSPARSRP